MGTEFPDQVNSVKENTLSGIGSSGLVGLASGYDSVSRVKAFFLSDISRVTLAELSGLSSDKTKTLPQAGFSLIPQPRLG
jgi:hypothetical protein